MNDKHVFQVVEFILNHRATIDVAMFTWITIVLDIVDEWKPLLVVMVDAHRNIIFQFIKKAFHQSEIVVVSTA